MFTSTSWLAYFESNRTRRASLDWREPLTAEPWVRSALIRSLQRFQVGDQDGSATATPAR
jgi:hypothetical protein